MPNASPLSSHQLRTLYDHDQRINVSEPGVRREVTPHTVRQINLHEPHSFVLHSNLTTDSVDHAIAQEIAYFESIGHDFEWKVYSHDTPPDLVGRLRARGFEIEDEETILVLDMSGLSGILAQPVTHDIRRIHDPAELAALLHVQSLVFEYDAREQLERFTREMREHPDYISFYAACVDNVPVATARINFTPNSQFASLWGGATLPAYRSRGIYTALVAARAQEAVARGRRFLTIDASPMSRPIVEKLGFVAICTSTPCQWEHGLSPAIRPGL